MMSDESESAPRMVRVPQAVMGESENGNEARYGKRNTYFVTEPRYQFPNRYRHSLRSWYN